MWTRREFLRHSGQAAAAACAGGVYPGPDQSPAQPDSGLVTLCLCGDVMTGRGIDQILPHPSRPALYERYMTSALGYLELAERASGPIPRPVGFDYIWGDFLPELAARSPDYRVVNLETSVTTSEDALPKGINYRMHPGNAGCLLAASIDCCVLANNHVLDWGMSGFLETLAALEGAGIAVAGAGRKAREAGMPASLQKPGRAPVAVFGFGSPTSGIPPGWAATDAQPGINLLPDLSPRSADGVADRIRRLRRPGDRAVVSIHWGGNWGYDIPEAQRRFARHLIDAGVADVVHGHSSHHPKGIEVYRGRLILYGAGDFLNDYEGIAGYETFRGELVLAYFATLEAATGAVARLDMVPFRVHRFRLRHASRAEAEWLHGVLDCESRELGARVELAPGDALALRW
ncbi:MAG: CapA family protein [Candidatus Methylomirabilales bacterium]